VKTPAKPPRVKDRRILDLLTATAGDVEKAIAARAKLAGYENVDPAELRKYADRFARWQLREEKRWAAIGRGTLPFVESADGGLRLPTIKERRAGMTHLVPMRSKPAARQPRPRADARPRARRPRNHARTTRAGPSSDDPSEPPPPNPRHRPAWKPVEGAAERGIERLLAVPTLTRLKRARHLIIEGENMPCRRRWELLEAALWPLAEHPLTTYNGYSPGEVSTGHKREPMKAPA
jgi:hypothetical protein